MNLKILYFIKLNLKLMIITLEKYINRNVLYDVNIHIYNFNFILR